MVINFVQTGYKLIDIYTCEILIVYIEIWRMYGQFHVSYLFKVI